MAVVLPMVKESQTSGGAGNLTGCAAVTNYWRGDTAPGGALNRRYKYWIQEGALHEFGIGYKSATGTFVRETILGNSSGTTAAITFTAAAVIISMELPGVTATFPAVYSEDGDGVGILQPHNTRPTGGSAPGTLAANRLYCQSLYWMGEGPLTEIGFDVVGAPATDATVYIGLYEINSVGEPGNLIVEKAISVLSAAVDLHTGVFTAPVMARRFFIGYVSTVALILRYFSNDQTMHLDGQLGSTADTPYDLLYANISTPTALPDPAPTAWTPNRLGVDTGVKHTIYGG